MTLVRYFIRYRILAPYRSTTYQAAALIIASALLLVAVNSVLDSRNETKSRTDVALVVLSYSSIVFNSGAAVAAFILIDQLGDLTLRSSQLNAQPSPEDGLPSRSTNILRMHGVSASWIWIMWHCESAMLKLRVLPKI